MGVNPALQFFLQNDYFERLLAKFRSIRNTQGAWARAPYIDNAGDVTGPFLGAFVNYWASAETYLTLCCSGMTHVSLVAVSSAVL